jgi:hypothetical protein
VARCAHEPACDRSLSHFFSTSPLRFPGGRAQLKVLSVALPVRRAPVGIVRLKNRTFSPAAKLFIDKAREARSHEQPIALAATEANIGAALRQRDKAIRLPLDASFDHEQVASLG